MSEQTDKKPFSQEEFRAEMMAPVTMPRVALSGMLAKAMVMGTEDQQLWMHDNAYREAHNLVDEAIERGDVKLNVDEKAKENSPGQEDRSEHKPCPFCGGPASSNTRTFGSRTVAENGWNQETFYGVNCMMCGCDNRGMCGFDTPEEAWAHWDRRA